MAPVQIDNILWANLTGRRGPFQDSNGNLWIVGKDSSASNSVRVVKSTDGGSTWGTSYTYGNIGVGAVNIIDCVFDAANNIIYCVVAGPSSAGLSNAAIVKFTIGTLAWGSVAGYVSSPLVYGDANSETQIFLVCRSNGSFVVFFQGNYHAMGNDYRAVYYCTCSSSGTWGTSVAVANSKTVAYDAKGAVLGELDRVHFLFTATAGTNTSLHHRSLASDNTLSNDDTIVSSQQNYSAYYHSIYYDSTLGKVVLTDLGNSQVRRGNSSATPNWSLDTNVYGSAEPLSSPAIFIYDPTDGKLYVFYRDATSDDLYYSSTTDTSWETNENIVDTATSISGISVGLIPDGIGVVYNDNGTVYFDKIVLSAPVPPVTANEEFFMLL